MPNGSEWTCTLSASPDRVPTGNTVTLTLTLSNREFNELPTDDARQSVYESYFCTFTCPSNQALQENANAAWAGRSRASPHGLLFRFSVPGIRDGDYDINVTASRSTAAPALGLVPPFTFGGSTRISVFTPAIQIDTRTTLQRTFAGPTDDRALWVAIRNRTAAIGFDRYQRFIECIFCHDSPDIDKLAGIGARCLDTITPPDKRHLSIYGPLAYSILKLATQVFLTLESGVVLREGNRIPKIFDIDKERIRMNDFTLDIDELKRELGRYLVGHTGQEHLPYLDKIVRNLITLDPENIREVLPYCLGVLQHRLTSPSLIELIWSYWLEEGMLVQTMNAIARRFQNRRGSPNDPLGELEFDTLRPLSNLIWGFIQDEHNRLTVPRRAHEYQHHYGLSLEGKAVSDVYPADSRSKFIEGYHNLLSAAARFFREDSDTTVIADAFPLLNALKEVHLLLAEGAHNQFGDLTWTARAEMLTMQWMLARPEMKEFLRGRYSVPYQEGWMGAVDSMKKLQGWTDTTITHFFELAVEGERILLTVRYGDWSDIENIEDQAKNWARSNKPEIQRYIHAYRTVTGVDLSAEITDTRDAATRYMQPSMLLQRRLAQQMSAMPLRAPRGADLVAARVSARAQLAAPARPRLPAYRKES
jgi:hypothetical protein